MFIIQNSVPTTEWIRETLNMVIKKNMVNDKVICEDH